MRMRMRPPPLLVLRTSRVRERVVPTEVATLREPDARELLPLGVLAGGADERLGEPYRDDDGPVVVSHDHVTGDDRRSSARDGHIDGVREHVRLRVEVR